MLNLLLFERWWFCWISSVYSFYESEVWVKEWWRNGREEWMKWFKDCVGLDIVGMVLEIGVYGWIL